MKAWWTAAIAATMLLVSGCQNGGHAQNSTDMRALNAVTDAEALDVLVDDDVKVAALPLGTTSPFSEFDAGTRDLKVRSSTNSSILAEKSISLGSGSTNTLVLLGKRGAMNTLLLADDTNTPSTGKFKIRAAGLSPDVGPVDLYITAGGVNDTVATVAGIAYGSTTDYTEVTPGTYRFYFTTAGTKDVVFQSPPQTFSEGAQLAAIVFPSGGGKLVNAVLLVQGTGGSGTYLTNPLGRMKSVNAIPDGGTLNFKADGATLLSNVPFAGSSSYVTTAAGARVFTIEASNVPGAAIATKAQAIDPARDYTVLALGTIASPQLNVLVDDNTLPNTGFAKLRFANALAGQASVDALVNFASQASGIALGTASGYVQVAPDTNYTITFSTEGGVNVIATIAPAELDAGGVYTAYLVGTSGAPQARLVRDR